LSLQYLTNANPPPTQSALEYDVEPGTVFVSTATEPMYADLTVTVSNTTSAPVNCMKFQFGFLAGAATGNLTTANEAGSVTASSQQEEWTITNNGSFSDSNPHLYLFTVTPSGIGNYLALAAGASLVFQISNILVDQSVGEGNAPFTIIEQTGTSNPAKQIVQGTLPIEKETSKLSLTAFNVDPPGPIAPGTPIELSWTVAGSTLWQLHDDTGKLLYDSNTDTPPKQTQWPIAPQQLMPQRTTTYEVTAWAGNLFTTEVALALVTNPRFTSIGAPTPNPAFVNSGAPSTLSWQTADAQYVIVTAEGYTSGQIKPDANGNGQVQVNPALTTTYTATPYGAGGEKGESAQVTVSVNPPLIKSFTASTKSFVRGQPVTLSWEVESPTSLVLTPGPVTLPPGATSTQVFPVGQVTYQLTAEGQGPSAQSQPITVTQQLQTFQVGHAPMALAYDGENIWVANESDGTVTKLLATDGSNRGTFKVGEPQDVLALAYDGNGCIWVSAMGSNAVTKLLASDGSIQGTFPVNLPIALASDGTYIWIVSTVFSPPRGVCVRLLAADGSPQGTFSISGGSDTQYGLAYDGNGCIWVANTGGGNVNKLLASDGSNQGTFNAVWPLALTSDGNGFIWVANGGSTSNTVTKLLASDGSIHGVFPVAEGPVALASDGTYIWVAMMSDAPTITVTRLLATDGSNQGTFSLLGPQPDVPSIAIAYDGTRIWVAIGLPTLNTVTCIWPSDWPPPSDNS
jgi:hypothetical protein